MRRVGPSGTPTAVDARRGPHDGDGVEVAPRTYWSRRDGAAAHPRTPDEPPASAADRRRPRRSGSATRSGSASVTAPAAPDARADRYVSRGRLPPDQGPPARGRLRSRSHGRPRSSGPAGRASSSSIRSVRESETLAMRAGSIRAMPPARPTFARPRVWSGPRSLDVAAVDFDAADARYRAVDASWKARRRAAGHAGRIALRPACRGSRPRVR